MACKVITISRTLAAGGEDIGHAAAKEFGFRYADEEIIVRAAEMAGVSPQTVAAVEHTPGFITRVLEAMARTAVDTEGYSPAAMTGGATREEYEGFIERVVRETAGQGKVVIVAHGASIPLTGTEGVFRCLVTASPATRIGRLVQEAKLSEAEARKAVEESDRQRREYLRRFYDVREELPTHYDVVVNTDTLSVPVAMELLIAAARSI